MAAPIAAIAAIRSILPSVAPVSAPQTGPAGFASQVAKMLQGASDGERDIDTMALDFATGKPVEIHDLMTATAKSQLAIDVLAQVRNKAIEAYQELSRIPL
jgi:flagellar hook-basal body complex protein FliE